MKDEQLILGEGQYGMAMEYLLVLQEIAMEQGVPPQTILKNTGVSFNALIQQEARIGHLSIRQAVKNTTDAIDDPTLPVQFAKRMSALRHGALGYAFQSAKNLSETIELTSKYIDTRSGGGQRIERTDSKNHVSIAFFFEPEASADVAHFQYLTMLFNIEYLSRYLTGTLLEHIADEIHITSPSIGDIPSDILPPGLTIKFEQPTNRVVYPKELFNRPLVTADTNVFSTALEQVKNEMMLLNPVFDVALIVRNKLQEHTGKLPSLQLMADDLHLSTSSLKRKLKNVGATYQQIRESVLFSKAHYLLETTQKSIDHIAGLLGYADGSNFNKAFKQWSGLTPSEYRKKSVQE